MNWADALTVSFGSNIYDDWRLPVSVEGNDVWGITSGFNIKSSELGHLYYTELNNLSGGPMTNTGPFITLRPLDGYWSATVPADVPSAAWHFIFDIGLQAIGDKGSTSVYAIAVRPGDVTIVPEPTLFSRWRNINRKTICRLT